MARKFICLSFAILLGGCASDIPQSIRVAPAGNLGISRVQADPVGTRGRQVRWGGEILSVINHDHNSDVVVLRRPLFNDGEPKPEGGEVKRFVARFAGFVDPAEFKAGQRLTVSGRVQGVVIIPVGEYRYPHPVVQVAGYHRWGKYEPPPEPPWHRDPFYCDPVWPWGYPRAWPYCW